MTTTRSPGVRPRAAAACRWASSSRWPRWPRYPALQDERLPADPLRVSSRRCSSAAVSGSPRRPSTPTSTPRTTTQADGSAALSALADSLGSPASRCGTVTTSAHRSGLRRTPTGPQGVLREHVHAARAAAEPVHRVVEEQVRVCAGRQLVRVPGPVELLRRPPAEGEAGPMTAASRPACRRRSRDPLSSATSASAAPAGARSPAAGSSGRSARRHSRRSARPAPRRGCPGRTPPGRCRTSAPGPDRGRQVEPDPTRGQVQSQPPEGTASTTQLDRVESARRQRRSGRRRAPLLAALVRVRTVRPVGPRLDVEHPVDQPVQPALPPALLRRRPGRALTARCPPGRPARTSPARRCGRCRSVPARAPAAARRPRDRRAW